MNYGVACVGADPPTYRVERAGRPLSWSEFSAALRQDAACGQVLSASLAAEPAHAFFWECCPRPAQAETPFEFVCVPTSGFHGQQADPTAFRSQLKRGRPATFMNLGKTAVLVAPPASDGADCLHLASFLRTASSAHTNALWKAVGHALHDWKYETLWLSTSGLGVPWLHIRLDVSPKYYTHHPYTSRLWGV